MYVYYVFLIFFFTGAVIDIFGCKFTMIVNCAVFIIGAIILAFASSIAFLVCYISLLRGYDIGYVYILHICVLPSCMDVHIMNRAYIQAILNTLWNTKYAVLHANGLRRCW